MKSADSSFNHADIKSAELAGVKSEVRLVIIGVDFTGNLAALIVVDAPGTDMGLTANMTLS